MKRALAVPLILVMLFAMMLPSPAAAGPWHGGRGIWWLPGAIIGGLALGAVAVVTAPFVALSAVAAASPAVTYAPPPVVYSPPATYAPPPVAYSPPATYAPPPVTYQAPPPVAAPAVQRVVTYPNGRYVLYGDGVRQPWQWVWAPAVMSPPPPPPMPQQ